MMDTTGSVLADITGSKAFSFAPRPPAKYAFFPGPAKLGPEHLRHWCKWLDAVDAAFRVLTTLPVRIFRSMARGEGIRVFFASNPESALHTEVSLMSSIVGS
jgi:hypothetical protein